MTHQLIKAAIIYKAELPSTEALSAHLKDKEFYTPLPTQLQSTGFVEIEEGRIAVEFAGGVAFRVRQETKIIPPPMVAKELAEAIKAITDETGRKPGKKERAEIKDQVIIDLATRAFSKTTNTTVFYERKTGYLIVPTTNQKLADSITSLLVHAVGSVKTETINVSNVSHGLTARLATWIKSKEGETDVFGAFHPQGEAVLTQEKRKLTVKMTGLEAASSALTEALGNGFEVASLGFTHNGKTEFRLTSNFRFKGLGFASTPDLDDEDAFGFAATASLEVADLSAVITELCELLSYKEGDELSQPSHAETDGQDPLYEKAVQIVTENLKVSISLVQRHLQIGYNRAARLVESMEKAGVVSPADENGARQLLARKVD